MTIHLSATATRVEQNTPQHLNDRILDRTAERIDQVASQGREAILVRLAQLEREWDIERTLITLSASLSLTGLALSRVRGPGFLAVPTVVLGFLLNHALQGWCPPVRPLRFLGFRTPREIEDERHALMEELRRAS